MGCSFARSSRSESLAGVITTIGAFMPLLEMATARPMPVRASLTTATDLLIELLVIEISNHNFINNSRLTCLSPALFLWRL
jgi:hypothetical protein